MKVLLTRKTIVIAAVAILIAIITIVFVNVFSSGGPVTGLANVLLSPLKSLASVVVQPFEGIYSSIYRYDALQKAYEEALEDLANIRRASLESEKLLRDYNTLRALLDFREQHADHVYEEATVRSWSSSNWASSFTISKGYANSDKPMARGNSVITEYGVLIGQISDVGATTSTVISIIDTTFSAGATVGDGGGSATAKGDFYLLSSGLLMLDHLDEDQIVLPGDSVVTSSVGGVFPAGLVIGEVVEVLRHDTGIGRYATVSPMREIDQSITRVFVITSYDITG